MSGRRGGEIREAKEVRARERKKHTCGEREREHKVRSRVGGMKEDVSGEGESEGAANIQLSSQGSQLGRLHVKQRL